MKKLCEDAAMAMYREGRLDREIAEAIGYSRVSVTNWRNNRGLPPNRGQKPKKMLDAYKAAMPLERVQELAQAEKDGRLWILEVLPGRPGIIQHGKSNEAHVIMDGEIYNDLVTCVHIGVDSNGELRCLYEAYDGHDFYSTDIGKTVFLTEEEAEAALKEGGGGQ